MLITLITVYISIYSYKGAEANEQRLYILLPTLWGASKNNKLYDSKIFYEVWNTGILLL